MYAAIVRSKEVKDEDGIIIPRGTRFVVVNGEWGITTRQYHPGLFPLDSIIWETWEEAEDFLAEWPGHPWYVQVDSYEIVEVDPAYKEQHIGYTRKGVV